MKAQKKIEFLAPGTTDINIRKVDLKIKIQRK